MCAVLTAEREKTMKTYYFVTNEMDADGIYGNAYPYCMTEEEVKYLSAEWDVNLFEKMHEATADELAQFGTGDPDDWHGYADT